MTYNKNWSAICPKCNTTFKSEDYKCDNCGKGAIKASVYDGGRTLYFGCDFCDSSAYQQSGLFKHGGLLNCPNCKAHITKKFIKTGCFIATAVYGDYEANEVKTLRNFRDFYLQKFLLGRIFILLYYKVSPPIADALSKHKRISKLVKIVLDKIVKLIRL